MKNMNSLKKKLPLLLLCLLLIITPVTNIGCFGKGGEIAWGWIIAAIVDTYYRYNINPDQPQRMLTIEEVLVRSMISSSTTVKNEINRGLGGDIGGGTPSGPH